MQAHQMANPEILNKVIEITKNQLSIKNDWEVTAQSNFIEDLSADSLDIVQIVAAIEEAYGIEIEDEKVESMVTVGKAVEVIEELLKAKA